MNFIKKLNLTTAIIKIIFFLTLQNYVIYSQLYFSSDPYYLLSYEKKQFQGELPFHATSIRPFYQIGDRNLSIIIKNQIFINNNASNQENMDLRYFGNGIGSFKSISISGYYKFLAFNLEPYLLSNNLRSGPPFP